METLNIHKIYPGSAGAAALALLNRGEVPMPLAPSVKLANGKLCIPQQYLLYQQTVHSISSTLSEIESVSDTLLFCGEDEFGLYLQVGTLGPDNYKRSGGLGERRLVYGRKWRIETYTPTSEVIQTAFLAIKKACEHEVRELLTVKDLSSGRTGTPFSTHVDLPLMAHFPELVKRETQSPAGSMATHWLQGIRFDGREIRIEEMIVRANGNVVLDLIFEEPDVSRVRDGFTRLPITIVLRSFDQAAVIHHIMNSLIQHSDRLVDEQFKYRGFARFSQELSPLRMAQLSISTRLHGMPDERFEQLRGHLNYETDIQRVPSLGVGALAEKNQSALEKESELGGHMPIEFVLEQRRVNTRKTNLRPY